MRRCLPLILCLFLMSGCKTRHPSVVHAPLSRLETPQPEIRQSKTPQPETPYHPILDASILKPSNDRNWSPDQATLPYAEYHGDNVTIHNIRNCQYRNTDDYTISYYDKTVNLNDVRSVDFIVVPFADEPTLAHTMLSFGLKDDSQVALSVEIRKEQGERFAPTKGILRQYEIMYVLGDERDLIGLRANHRMDDVFVYRTRATPDQARRLFEDVLARTNKLYREPEFYNTLTNNCTTNIRRHINSLSPDRIPYDYRVLFPGYADQMAYDLGLLDTKDSFEQTKLKARVTEKAFIHRDDPDFSRAIRR